MYVSTPLLLFSQFLEAFNEFVLNLPAFSLPMRHIARLLLINQQGGPLAQLHITPELPAMCKTVGAIVIHTVSVLESCSKEPILLPFLNMITNPAALSVSTTFMYLSIVNTNLC